MKASFLGSSRAFGFDFSVVPSVLAVSCALTMVSCTSDSSDDTAPEDTAGNGYCGGELGSGEEPSDEAPAVSVPWDWNGVVGTGQSLAVGQNGTPARSTTQPYGNLKLSTGTAMWPIDPEDASFELVPLTEPIGRRSTAYPSSYPTNIAGETPHAAMANQISALVEGIDGEHVGVHGEYGENGQCLGYLAKGVTPNEVNGRAFEATLLETQAIARLAALEGKSYGVGAVIVTHGECDAGSSRYADGLYQLWSDYNTDIAAITGQDRDLLMIVSQQNSVNNRAASTLAQWRVGVDHPDEIVCSGPKYQYQYSSDGIHLNIDGYQALGEKYGQIYYERVVLERNWQPLQPTTVERIGSRSIRVDFHVPVPPLVWESEFDAPLQAVEEWKAGKGFELRSGSKRLAIRYVEICDSSVTVETTEDLPESDLFIGYALTGQTDKMAAPHTGTFRWGLLRDSDPFVGSSTGLAQPNFAVAFELAVP
jgi:hypothetical protein